MNEAPFLIQVARSCGVAAAMRSIEEWQDIIGKPLSDARRSELRRELEAAIEAWPDGSESA